MIWVPAVLLPRHMQLLMRLLLALLLGLVVHVRCCLAAVCLPYRRE
jgi:hypothetical protein